MAKLQKQMLYTRLVLETFGSKIKEQILFQFKLQRRLSKTELCWIFGNMFFETSKVKLSHIHWKHSFWNQEVTKPNLVYARLWCVFGLVLNAQTHLLW